MAGRRTLKRGQPPESDEESPERKARPSAQSRSTKPTASKATKTTAQGKVTKNKQVAPPSSRGLRSGSKSAQQAQSNIRQRGATGGKESSKEKSKTRGSQQPQSRPGLNTVAPSSSETSTPSVASADQQHNNQDDNAKSTIFQWLKRDKKIPGLDPLEADALKLGENRSYALKLPPSDASICQSMEAIDTAILLALDPLFDDIKLSRTHPIALHNNVQFPQK
jgi:hypothetical protein